MMGIGMDLVYGKAALHFTTVYEEYAIMTYLKIVL